MTTDWTAVAEAAAREAGDLDPALLGDFLPALAEACAPAVVPELASADHAAAASSSDRAAAERLAAERLVSEWGPAGRSRLDRHKVAAFRALGARAADEGVALPALIDLYLSAAWRAWPHLPSVRGADAGSVRGAGEIVLHAVDDVVAAAADGFRAARRAAVRLEESDRREFVDDLLAGTGDAVEMLNRAERFGVDPAGPHLVAVAAGGRPVNDNSPLLSQAASAAPGALVVTRGGVIVAVLPATGDERAAATRIAALTGERLAAGRVHAGVSGVARSYAEAKDALRLAARLHRDDQVVFAEDLLIYRVLVRDRAAIDDLIAAVLAPLGSARGGAEPLLETLDAYLSTGGNTVATARVLHLSARAVTYRLKRIHELTGRDPADPEDRFVLQAARLGSRALG